MNNFRCDVQRVLNHADETYDRSRLATRSEPAFYEPVYEHKQAFCTRKLLMT